MLIIRDEKWGRHLCEGEGICQAAQLHRKLQRCLSWQQCRNINRMGCKQTPVFIAHIPEWKLVSFYIHSCLHSRMARDVAIILKV